jgi:hypothetical protein
MDFLFVGGMRRASSLTKVYYALRSVADADPDPACHFDADPNPNFQRKAQNLGKVLK